MNSIDEITKALRHVQLRTGMYLGTREVPAVGNFLTGLQLGFRLCGMRGSLGDFRDEAARRGWSGSAGWPVDQMRQQGLSDEAIVDELFEIQIATIRRAKE